MKLTVAQLARRLDAELVGNGSGQITSVGAIEAADQNTITFVMERKHIPKLEKSRAAAVIVDRAVEDLEKPQLLVKNVNTALIETLSIFAPKLKPPPKGIDPTAKIGKNVRIAKSVSIGPAVIIDDNAQIKDNTFIAAGCKIGQNTKIGRNCRLDCNIVIYHNCIIGNNVIIQANTTIGSTGFGYCLIDGQHKLIPHNGGVVIEDFVEIGANCCVDRAKFGNTIIGAGTKIDNLVQIAHNVVIGKCCLIAGQVGISGSCKLGDGVILGGQAGLTDNIVIGDAAMVGGQSGVFHNIAAAQQLFGTPAIDKTEAVRLIGLTRRLPKLVSNIKKLTARIERLEAAKNNK